MNAASSWSRCWPSHRWYLLTSYNSWPRSGGTSVAGVPIPQIVVAVETLRPVQTAYQPIYSQELETPNKALAVAYPDRWRMTPRPCSKYTTTYDFTFEWKITLDKARP